MRVVVVTAPAPVVSWDEAAAHLRLDVDDEQQTYVTALIAAATAALDGPDGWLGRSLGVQTLEATFDRFPCWDGPDQGALRLTCRPIKSITSVKFLDGSNVLTTWPSDQYELLGADLVTVGSVAWPSTYLRRDAVTVRYVAGYDTLPPPIRAAILLMVGDLFVNRETTAPSTVSSIPMSATVDRLIAPYRVIG